MRVLCLFVLSLLPLLAPRSAPPPCVSTVVLAGGFDGYYALYWNGRLLGQGSFVYDLSAGVSLRRLSNGETEDRVGFCVGKVADRNELVIKNQAGNTIFRRFLRKREVAPTLQLDKYGRVVSLTPQTGALRLQ